MAEQVYEEKKMAAADSGVPNYSNKDEAMKAAMEHLDLLHEKLDKAVENTDNASFAIKEIKKTLKAQKADENKYIKGAVGVVTVAKSVVDNYDKFTSGDALTIAAGAIALIGTIGTVVGGPFGPLIGGVCGLIAAILPLFGGSKGPSMAEVVEKVIKEALDDFKDDDIYENVMGSLKDMNQYIAYLNGFAEKNAGKVGSDEKGFLQQLQFGSAANRTLGQLQAQIEKYKGENGNETKTKRVAMYMYYYCMISTMKQLCLSLQCSLLRVNEMENIFSGINKYLNDTMESEDKKLLDFIAHPSDKIWRLYREVHLSLDAPQRALMDGYRLKVKCDPMEGRLCVIYNVEHNEYLYQPLYCGYDDDRRRVLTYREKTADGMSLFRIIGEDDDCFILGVYQGEYIYAASDGFNYDNDRRKVFSWRPGVKVGQGHWLVESAGDTIRIKNKSHNEYLYAASDGFAYDGDRRRVFTWIPGDVVSQGRWLIKPISFTKDDLNNPVK